MKVEFDAAQMQSRIDALWRLSLEQRDSAQKLLDNLSELKSELDKAELDTLKRERQTLTEYLP